MPAEITVLCAVSGPAETDVVLALGAPGTGTSVTRRCGDLTELLAAAAAGAGQVAVVSADLPGLDREAVGRLHGAGARVVALADDGPAERLRALGFEAVLDGPADPRLLDAVRDTARVDDPLATRENDLSALAGHDPEGPRHGAVVAVWGPVGAPGRTTTAIELAAELAGVGGRRSGRRRGRRETPAGPAASALVVDADTYGSCVASRLGLLDDAPGLAAVARAAGHGTLDLATLSRHAPVVEGRLRVLTGITRAARWPELPASALEVVLERARALVDWTVVDCGPLVEADELLMYDTHAPQRNGATLAALQAADLVVVVGAADPVGVQRVVRALEDLAEAPVPVPAARIVVANRVRSSAVGPDPARAVGDALARYAGVGEMHAVPDDGPALDAALLAGRTLAEHAPSSAARQAFAGLAALVRERAGADVPA
ncbi:CpaE family protein [Isoptericola halotolerans]|uniref:AAA family ATPase n=1 Tax=Isoptericola halotolerans TaxID=300560 RepID=UPI003890A4AD